MKKDIVLVSFLALILLILVSGTKIQSVDEYYLTHIDEVTSTSETVTLEIRADTLKNNRHLVAEPLQKYIPEDGVILAKDTYVLRPDDTVFTILHRVVRHHRIQMEFQGADKNIYNSAYIQGINHLYEFSAGPLSGWTYTVNQVFPNYGVSQYTLKDGDAIQFLYTVDLARDVGGGFE